MKNKKLLLGIIGIWLCSGYLSAQTLHAVLVANTQSNNPEFATICQNDVQNLEKRIAEMGKAIACQWKIYTVIGNDFHPDSLQKKVDSIEVRSGDILLFYYSGAATCEEGNPDKNQQRVLHLGRDSNLAFSTTSLFSNIQSKGARLNLLMVDACGLIREMLPFTGTKSTVENEVYASLLSACGTVKMFSSQCSEFSYGARQGSLFSNAWLDALDHFISIGAQSLRWKNLLEWTKHSTSQRAADIFRLQHPTFYFSEDFLDQCEESK